jgi:hypothetical protein
MQSILRFFSRAWLRNAQNSDKTPGNFGFKQQGLAALFLLRLPPVSGRVEIVSETAVESVWRLVSQRDGQIHQEI